MPPRPAKVIWSPQSGPQTALLACPVFEVFFGGARGGGKTDGVLGDFVSHAGLYGQHAIGIMLRRDRTQLMETIERSRQIYGPIGAKFHEQDKYWRFPNGARLRYAYLDTDSDADAYQGHSYTRVYPEEVGTFAMQAPIMKMMATLRSGHGVPVGMRGTGNPGGPGHQWVKARYIDPAPLGWQIIKSTFKNPFTGETVERERVFIPSKVTDNRYLGTEYIASLQMSGNASLVRAWLEGDWSVIQGAYFPEWSTDRHVVPPVELPKHWTRFRALDWGTARPFSVGWYAVSDGELPEFPRGALVRYREWYGVSTDTNGQYEPNIGVRLTATACAAGIKAREAPGEEISYGVADPSIFSFTGGVPISEDFHRAGVTWRKADNTRVPQRGSMSGWNQVRSRLVGDDDRPMLYVFSTNQHLIRTLPALQHDPLKPEDVDSEGEDHAADELRYACMSRPYQRVKPVDPEDIKGLEALTMNRLWKQGAGPQGRRIG